MRNFLVTNLRAIKRRFVWYLSYYEDFLVRILISGGYLEDSSMIFILLWGFFGDKFDKWELLRGGSKNKRVPAGFAVFGRFSNITLNIRYVCSNITLNIRYADQNSGSKNYRNWSKYRQFVTFLIVFLKTNDWNNDN